MPDSGINNQDHFVKQRRNLVLISLFVVFYKAGDLAIEKINLLGNETDIGNPEIVHLSLGIFFLYFLLRYYTACRAVSGVKKFWRACQAWFEKRCRHQIHAVLKANNINYTSEPHVKKSAFFEVQITFRPNPSFSHEAHGKEIPARLVEQGKHEEYVYSYGVKYWPWRFYSAIYSIFNYTYFLEYVFPYMLALLAVLELFEIGVIEKIVAI